MKGFFNRLLRVDLSKRKTTIEPIPESILRSYLGGKGLGSYLLLKENPPRIDPFSPENRLIFTLGPLADTPFMVPAAMPSSPNPLRQESIVNLILEERLPFLSAGRDTMPSSLKGNRIIPSFSKSAIRM